MNAINTKGDILNVRLRFGIQKIVLNRPKKRNALTVKMYQELIKILNDSSKDNSIHMVVLTGAGDFFTSGNDFLDAFNTTADFSKNSVTVFDNFKNFIDALINFPKLLIAVVNGPAIGIGTTMLGLFDMVFASDKAYFSTPFSKFGLLSEGCSSYTFPRIMGPSKAGEMLYFCHMINAEEAKACGLVGQVYKDEGKVWMYLGKLGQLSIESIMATKRLIQKWNKQTLLEVNKAEVEELKERLGSPDIINKLINLLPKKSKL